MVKAFVGVLLCSVLLVGSHAEDAFAPVEQCREQLEKIGVALKQYAADNGTPFVL